ncbi:ABC transporter substrate-binding protein [Cryobacterium sp. W22_MBD10_FK3]|uniref:ABC transporter substrate-binding protein n=1 Tax=Cryobacterium sp. W22_MBD10_FK3 TaxID=3240273 RepID=UPI003F92956F
MPSKKPLRLISLIGFGLAATLATSACAGSAGAPQADPAAPVDLSFSNWQWLEAGKGEILWDSVKDYAGPNDNVTLTKVEAPYASYADKLNTEIGAKGGADVLVLQDSQFATLADAGALEPLDDVGDELGAALNGSNDAGLVEDARYGFNWERPGYALIYNKDLIASAGIEVPTTYPELLAAATAVQANLGISGFAGRHQTAEVDGWTLEFANWINGFGGALSEDGELTINSPENVEAAESFVELFTSGVVPVGDDASTFRAKFAQNQVGFLIDNAGVAVTLTSNPENLVTGQNLGAAPLPFTDPGSHTQLILAVNANSKNKEAAKDFVRWILSDEGQTAIRPALGASVLATDTPPSAEFLAANPFAEEYLKLAQESTSSLIPGFETDSKAIWREVLSAVEGALVRGDDVKDAFDAVQDKVVNEFG